MAGILESAKHDQADEVAVVEARRGGVAPVVEGDRPIGQPGGQGHPVGRVVHEAAPVEVVEEIIHRRHRPRPPAVGPTRASSHAGSSGPKCGRMV